VTMPGEHTSLLDSDENQRRVVQAISEQVEWLSAPRRAG
jgi:hypothetical protein